MAGKRYIPKKIKDFILIASKHQCSICQANTIDVHHIIPVEDGGTNDLENLMVVCPNHHRQYHQGKFTEEQMRTYRTQWLQKCRVFFEIGIPAEKLIKDRIIASELPLELKIQFIQESANCVVETLAVDQKMVSLFFSSGSQSPSEITRDVINLAKLLYRLFKDSKIIRCTFPNNSREKIILGLDVPEFYSFAVAMKDVDKFVFGKLSVQEFWKKITFFKKRDIDITNYEVQTLQIPLVV